MRSFLILAFLLPGAAVYGAEPKPFELQNLTAWCIVPFDAKKRGPEERVVMLKRLGFTRYAYDWRTEHLPTFEKELVLLQKEKITLQGVWFPAGVGPEGQTILDLLKKHKIETELWVMLPQPDAKAAQDDKVKTTAALLAALAKTAGAQGCKVGVYNHGGWAGEPENMVAVVKACGEKNVGIVYNFHHGHDHLAKLDDNLKSMKPYLYSISLNGMEKEGDKKGKKLLVISDGPEDRSVMNSVTASGFQGPFNILGHTDDDVEERLTDNLNGLKFLSEAPAGERLGFLTPSTNTLQIRIAAPKLAAPLAFIVSNFTVIQRQKLMEMKREFNGQEFGVRVHRKGEAGDLMEGNYTRDENRLIFTPRFPPTPGVEYSVTLDPSSIFDDPSASKIVSNITLRKVPPVQPTAIENLFPTADTLPENTLRMYVQFTAPMKRGNVYRHIQLLKEDGKPVVLPFLELDEELWSQDGKRLTLLFDPGRVKRGLKPREDEGPILEEGKKFTLVIDQAWEDETGFPLKAPVKKSFRVLKPDDTPIDPKLWKLSEPTDAAGNLRVAFEKPLDRALAERMLSIENSDGNRVPIAVIVNASQSGVEIRPPSQGWKPGRYKLVIDKRLEDVCGNRVGEAFELDELRPTPLPAEPKSVERPFTVK